eukprot:13193-Heterococcus_DN1.PRE.3
MLLSALRARQCAVRGALLSKSAPKAAILVRNLSGLTNVMIKTQHLRSRRRVQLLQVLEGSKTVALRQRVYSFASCSQLATGANTNVACPSSKRPHKQASNLILTHWPRLLAHLVRSGSCTAFDAIKLTGAEPGFQLRTVLISACGKSGQWQEAVRIFNELPAAGMTPNVHSFTAVMEACNTGQQQELTLSLLQQMRQHGLQPTAPVTQQLSTHAQAHCQ